MQDRKFLELSNGIKVLLISDTRANKASCAIDIMCGSMRDPIQLQGLSHLLEHMLFKGSAKYSDGNSFSSILYANQGIYNISTGAEHSSFCFEVSSSVLKEALFILADSLSDPLLEQKDIEPEIRLIDQEFSINKKDPDHFCRYIFNKIGIVKDHPVSKFFHGNKKTLLEVKTEDLRRLLELYHSSPINIVCVSKQPIKEMEDLIEGVFCAYKVGTKERFQYETPIFKKDELPNMLLIEYFGGKPFLRLSFETKGIYSCFKTKPNWIITSIINSERNGSLMSLLKNKNLAENLWSSFDNMSLASFLNIDVFLSPKGVSHVYDVIKYVHSYLEFVTNKGYPEYIFNEQRLTAEAGFRFKEHKEGSLYVKGLARNMHYYDPLFCEEQSELIYEYGIKDLNEVLSALKPELSRSIFYGSTDRLKQQDEYYGASYGYETKTAIPCFSKRYSYFRYPEPNIFISTDFSHVVDDGIHYPRKIMDNDKGVIWFMQDWAMELPYLYVNLLLLSDLVNKDPKSKLMSIIFSKLFNESLRDIADMAGEAGLSFDVDRTDRGFSFYFAGYSDKLFTLIEAVTNAFSNNFGSQLEFNKIKRSLALDYKELSLAEPYPLVQYHKYDLMHKNNIHYTEYVGLLKKLELKDIELFHKKTLKHISVESFVYGNSSVKEVISIVEKLYLILGSNTMDVSKRPKDLIIKMPRGNSFYHYIKTKEQDAAWTSYFDFGARNIRLSAIIQLGFGFLKGFFFDQMRNNRGLGYIVESRLDFFEHVLGISFTVVSNKVHASKISKEAGIVFNDFIDYILKLSDEDLERSRASLIASVSKQNRTIEEWMTDVVLTSVVNGDPDYATKLCEHISKITKEELCDVFSQNLCGENRTSINVYADTEFDEKEVSGIAIVDPKSYKNSSNVYQ